MKTSDGIKLHIVFKNRKEIEGLSRFLIELSQGGINE